MIVSLEHGVFWQGSGVGGKSSAVLRGVCWARGEVQGVVIAKMKS